MGDRLGIHSAVDIFTSSVVRTMVQVISPSPLILIISQQQEKQLPPVRLELTAFRLWDWRAAYCATEACAPARHIAFFQQTLRGTSAEKKLCQKGDSNPRPHKRTRNLHLSPIGGQGLSLESGALDHSAILTRYWEANPICGKIPVIRARVELATFCV